MRKAILAVGICLILLLTGGTALAQGGGAGWFDFVTDVRLHGQVWILNDLTIGDNLTLTDDLTADAVTAADLTATDDVIVGDDLTIGGWYSTTKQTTIVVSDGSTVTPLGSYAPISSTASTGTSAIAGPTAGRRLTLVNVANTTITFTDTGTLKLNGNVALSQYDAVQLLGDGTNWIQIAPVGNN